ncbi:ATP-grasp domain-containing protein [Lutimonas halocynthiae]|uniref:ATP-grasp domain-containing protein n=1 Tax=Lutimonas halocynthiae TaxID=1446477 RepID=UPI0025B35C83|nr:ATP-grasp domain-containing protein [Lutimonas halocynthiae]MDN3643798.1 ATP-grasp domain-containing protein [Lutimonas halocynthiae]
MKNILISSAGRRVSLIRSFIKEANKINKNIKIYAADANPNSSAACLVADAWFRVPLLDSKDYLNILIEECKRYNIGLIIPTIDTELQILADNISKLRENGIDAVISDSSFVKKCRDKRMIHDFFESKGVQVAKEYPKDKLEFPLFIKPSDGSRSVDIYYIETQEDLTDYHFSNDKFMFLEYLDQELYWEYTCDLYYDKKDNLKCVVPRKRIEVRDGEVNKGKTEKNELVPFIKNHLQTIKGARGCLTVQFFFNENLKKIIGIEINPRFGGGYPLSYLAGANFPKWIIEEYLLGNSVKYFDEWEKNLLMLRYDDEILVHDYEE